MLKLFKFQAHLREKGRGFIEELEEQLVLVRAYVGQKGATASDESAVVSAMPDR